MQQGDIRNRHSSFGRHDTTNNYISLPDRILRLAKPVILVLVTGVLVFFSVRLYLKVTHLNWEKPQICNNSFDAQFSGIILEKEYRDTAFAVVTLLVVTDNDTIDYMAFANPAARFVLRKGDSISKASGTFDIVVHYRTETQRLAADTAFRCP